MNISRRSLLLGTAAVSVTAVLPVAPAAAKLVQLWGPETLNFVPKPPRVAYFVGTPGDMNGEYIRARSPQDAWEIWCTNNDVFDEDNEIEEQIPPFDPQSVHRVESWDELKHVYDANLLDAGFTTTCSKCGYERHKEDGESVAVGPMVFCFSCAPVEAAA